MILISIPRVSICDLWRFLTNFNVIKTLGFNELPEIPFFKSLTKKEKE